MFSYTLNAVRSLKNYGISILGSTYDPAFTKGFLLSSPNVSIVGSTCYIDYSATTNISDLTYLLKVFGRAPAGTTFALSSGNYYDEDKNIFLDISGVFSKNTLTNSNKLIIGTIVSGFTYTSNYSYFNKNYFTVTPQYSTSYVGGATFANYIVNNITSNPEKSFINAGIIGSCFGTEEYVELNSTTSNTGKLKINSVLKLKDNKEILYTDTVLSNENLGNTLTTATFYLRGNADPIILNVSRKNLGCYVVVDNNGNQITCFENQNRLQAFLRSQDEPASYSANWIPCLDCSRLTDNAINIATADYSLLFDNSIFFYVVEQQIPTFPTSTSSLSYVYTLYSNYNGNAFPQPTNAVTFISSYGIKLDLSHPTLKQFSVNVYSDSTKNNIVTQNLYKIGIPGFDQASIIYQKTDTNSKILYLEFVGPVTFDVTVTVQ